MRPSTAIPAVLLAAAAAGCASTGYEQADSAAGRIRDVRAEVDRFKAQSDATLETLAALLAVPRTGLKEKFEAYARAVDDLGRQESSLKSSVEAMRTAAQNRFREWEKETAGIANPDIRGRAAERRGEVEGAYKAAETAVAEFVVAVVPFSADLRDLRLALSNDLTSSGLDAVRDTASKARNAAGRLSGRTRPVNEALEQAVAELSTGEPAPERVEETPAEAASAGKE